mmetsp:Transcript_14855/g.16897  ORF Transcript_14855/g.16897 Transcript_14855/m.16897 type:complete len:185 (-) Transcript_14855:1866-2420(-)
MPRTRKQRRLDPMESLRGAFHDNDLEKVQQVIQQNQVNVKDPKIICEASHYDCLDTIKWLHEQGADITADDNLPLKNAVWYNRTEIVTFLIDNGADAKSRDNNAIVQASEHGNLEIVKYLVSKGADITAQENASAYCASEHERYTVVQYLYEQGADLNGIANKDVIMKYLLDHCDIKYTISPYK